MINKIIKQVIKGFVYGVFIGQTILILDSLIVSKGVFHPVSPYLLQHTNTIMNAAIIQYFITGLIGISFGTSALIFETDKWSITIQTLLHFVINSTVMFFSCYIGGLFPFTARSIFIWASIFLVIYVIMWITLTLYYRRQTKKINEFL